MIYAIYACEQTYRGLHGFYLQQVVKCENEDEAYEIAEEMGKEVISDNFSLKKEYIADAVQQIEDLGDERSVAEVVEELINENLKLYIWGCDSGLIKDKRLTELNVEFCQDKNNFVNKYNCIKI